MSRMGKTQDEMKGHEMNKAEVCIHLFPTLAVAQKTEFPGFKTRIHPVFGATSVGAKLKRRGGPAPELVVLCHYLLGKKCPFQLR